MHSVLLLTIYLISGVVYSEADAFKCKNMKCSLTRAQNAPSRDNCIHTLYKTYMTAKITTTTTKSNNSNHHIDKYLESMKWLLLVK